MPLKTTGYVCDYCGKIYRHKSSASSHEKRCFWNPENRACASCGNQDTDHRYCAATGADLSTKGELKRHCVLWIPEHDDSEL